MERKFKNVVLATYHEESVTSLDEASGAFRLDTEAVQKRLKTARQEFHYKLKPSHGHPRNTSRLESLMADFQRFNAECANTLSGTCDRIEIGLEKIDKNYDAMCPKDVLEAATLYVKCFAKLKTLLENINDSTSATASIGSGDLPESLAKPGVEQAISNMKSHLRTKSGIIFWPDNSQLWSHNVQVFSRLCRERFGDVQTFSVVEKAKMVDWAMAFVRDVERVKELNSQYVTI
ncbi:uncharacterized protein LOC132938239 [Metopolophium dirhodum]|uniref:uncharacterized protein LOC132938239 n=1 Tax=Metopolophium dirhodum TaxID=44670 RepID=UPI00298FC3D1|nr:uncharacterized protein LOC132938239 [Metopolophium dirhodum]